MNTTPRINHWARVVQLLDDLNKNNPDLHFITTDSILWSYLDHVYEMNWSELNIGYPETFKLLKNYSSQYCIRVGGFTGYGNDDCESLISLYEHLLYLKHRPSHNTLQLTGIEADSIILNIVRQTHFVLGG